MKKCKIISVDNGNEKKVKKYRQFLWALLAVSFGATVILGYYEFTKTVPSRLIIRENREEKIQFHLPVSASIYENSVLASSIGGSNQEKEGPDVIETTAASSFVMKAKECNSYQMDLKLFGIVPVKTVDLEVVEEQEVYPMGLPVGIYLLKRLPVLCKTQLPGWNRLRILNQSTTIHNYRLLHRF